MELSWGRNLQTALMGVRCSTPWCRTPIWLHVLALQRHGLHATVIVHGSKLCPRCSVLTPVLMGAPCWSMTPASSVRYCISTFFWMGVTWNDTRAPSSLSEPRWGKRSGDYVGYSVCASSWLSTTGISCTISSTSPLDRASSSACFADRSSLVCMPPNGAKDAAALRTKNRLLRGKREGLRQRTKEGGRRGAGTAKIDSLEQAPSAGSCCDTESDLVV